MPLMLRCFTSKDLKYYYFYYRVGCSKENCVQCGIRQETEIFCHLLDSEIIAKAERILSNKIKAFQFSEYAHADRVHYAAIHYFYPQNHKVGKVIKIWGSKQLEQLVPKKRRSEVAWYFVDVSLLCSDKMGEQTDKFLRSKSFPANSPEEAIQKANRWLKKYEKRLKKKESIYCASIHYANSNRGSFSLPGTDSNLLRRP